jgi:hypothetical protein
MTSEQNQDGVETTGPVCERSQLSGRHAVAFRCPAEAVTFHMQDEMPLQDIDLA